MASNNSVKSQLEAFETKFDTKLQENLNDFKKNLLKSFTKIEKMESLLLLVNIKNNLKLQEEVTKSVIMATLA